MFRRHSLDLLLNLSRGYNWTSERVTWRFTSWLSG